MKKFFLSLVAMMVATMSFAQNGLVATLSSGSDITMFYGVTALQKAAEAAKSGDVINLSSGSFNAANINAAITLRGAGIDSETPTYIIGDFTIEIPTDDANRFMMEGIRCQNTMLTKGTFANPYFVKCQFYKVSNAKDYDQVTNIMFVNCKITDYINYGANDTYSFVNCYLGYPYQYEASTATFSNCIVISNDIYYLRQAHFMNCIFYSPGNKGYALPNNTQAANCICINYSNDVFRDLSVKPNCSTANREDVFKTFTGEYSDAETFELTDAAKKTYLGTDGEQIGLYGGLQPYNSTPSYPLISTMAVDKQTTTDGKLGVTIEVSK